MAERRFVVTQIEGYLDAEPGIRRAGKSAHVIDTGWNRRLVASYRSEQGGRPLARARRHAAILNARFDNGTD
jgi:hypothetical protein